MTFEQIDAEVNLEVREVAGFAQENNYQIEELEVHDYVMDRLNELWDVLHPYAGEELIGISAFSRLGEIYEYIDGLTNEKMLEKDSEYWNGEDPYSDLCSQMYHSIRNIMRKKLRILHVL